MKRIIILASIIFSACRIPAPFIAPQLRCTLSFQFEKCRCHEYDLMKAKRISEPADYPLEYCDDLTGFSPKSWAEDITPWARESIRFYNDTCK